MNAAVLTSELTKLEAFHRQSSGDYDTDHGFKLDRDTKLTM